MVVAEQIEIDQWDKTESLTGNKPIHVWAINKNKEQGTSNGEKDSVPK